MKQDKTGLILAILLMVGIIFMGPELGLFSVITDDDVVRAEIISPMTISKGEYLFEITNLYLEDSTINKGTVDFTQSYNNLEIGNIDILGKACPTYMSVSTYHVDSSGKRVGGSWGSSTGDYRDQKTGEIIRQTPQTGDNHRVYARWSERNYFSMPNGEYEIEVLVRCRLSDVNEDSVWETIGNVKTGIKVNISGESLHSLGTAEQAARIEELTSNIEEQGMIIASLELTMQEKQSLIAELTNNINHQTIIINQLELTAYEQLQMINQLTNNIEEQAQMINQLTINLQQKADLINQLTATNEEQAELIRLMKISFSDQADIINALNNEISDDAQIINNLDLTIQEQVEIISQMGLTNEEQADLVSQMELSLSEQQEIIESLNLALESEAQTIIDLNLQLSEQAQIIDTYPSIEAQSEIINSLGLSLSEKNDLVNQLSLSLEEKQDLIDLLESEKESIVDKPLFSLFGVSITILYLVLIVLFIVVIKKSNFKWRKLFK